MQKFRKYAIRIFSVLAAAFMFAGTCLADFKVDEKIVSGEAALKMANSDGKINNDIESYFDSNVVQKISETFDVNEEISIILQMDTQSVIDAYNSSQTEKSVSEYIATSEAKKTAAEVAKAQNSLLRKLKKSGLWYKEGAKYDTVLSGVEVTIKAKDFEKLGEVVGNNVQPIIGNEYEPAQAVAARGSQPAENIVDVYETGIFNSSGLGFNGDGVVVAVLDTGLDYTHPVFSAEKFHPEIEAFTLASVSAQISKTAAASYSFGLTGEDVYMNKKVPFAYDYADKDPDVMPINSEHGTHVAGIIAGKDERITGVAPMAQLAIMKVFSDHTTGAKDSWIISALEDCVTLGVDVINMSLGSSCGFTTQEDEERKSQIYESIREAGISLIAAASNDSNATSASEKNGSNPLTSNPDSGTVGAPSTYPAALSVASVDGVKTPYLLYNDEIIYFTEASISSAKPKHFVDDILKTCGEGVTEHTFEYVTIPGIGRAADYPEEGDFYHGKIVLVKRGQTTFEEKVRIALKEKGAAGVIIYNNVSGKISMSVGADVGAVCSITQDDGELLAKADSGYIKISKGQTAGPFMSDFSSWGPTSDLKIKPEITAHGGEIESAVPGGEYDRLSGTSMAAPNQAGATALIRQYVKYDKEINKLFGGNLTNRQITDIVNQLMMSTADIIINKNWIPAAVRKQGAGLVNMERALNSAAYITTYDKDNSVMERTKLELGDDKQKTGRYEVKFTINNIKDAKIGYDIGAIITTEGVSPTYTGHGDTTSTQEGYLLEGAKIQVLSVTGGELSGNNVSVNAKSKATVTAVITLSDEDKAYLDKSFEYGMYVEGFVTLKAQSGTTVDLNVPMLAFYGDWTEAPIFDEEYYDTNKDELNKGLDTEDKLMADAYATRAIGKLFSDYIATLGSYYFVQDPAATPIAADKKYIAISNQEGDEKDFTICGIYAIWAGLLRNVKEAHISVVEDATGKEIFYRKNINQQKTYTYGGSIRQSSIDVDFMALERELKNNTKYTVSITTYIDYGKNEEQKNVRNVFEFPLFIDYQAPVVTDVVYRKETDRTTKKSKLFADISIYDNHYAMSVQLGQVIPSTDPEYLFTIRGLGKYMTPVYSEFNSTSTVTIELTDYVAQIMKDSVGASYDEDGNVKVVNNTNTFTLSCYDYAMNSSMCEIKLPDEILDMAFAEEELTLKPNETYDLVNVLSLYPEDAWLEVLSFDSSNKAVADVVNHTIVAKSEGTATITAIAKKVGGGEIRKNILVKVEGKAVGTMQEVNKFLLTGYTTIKAYHGNESAEREIGENGGTYSFGGTYALSMYPSESVKINSIVSSYVDTWIAYKVGNKKIAQVSDDGTIVALAEGSTYVSVTVMNGEKATLYSERISITVKNPYKINSIYLMSYKGMGGEVVIPDDRGITTIYDYAFSNYEWVDKDPKKGDVINEEDSLLIKQQYIGEEYTIEKIIIPEGVTHINSYAFAGLKALKEVVLPSTLKTIGIYAFYDCNKLLKINLENVKFFNEYAFANTALEEIKLDSAVAIGNNVFENCNLNYVELPECAQSIGSGAFKKNSDLSGVKFKAEEIKIGNNVFEGCTNLTYMYINTPVIAPYAFKGCSSLTEVELGKAVSVIGEFAFAGTQVSKFIVEEGNAWHTNVNGTFVFSDENEETLVLVAPVYVGSNDTITTTAKYIAAGAFSANTRVVKVVADEALTLGAYAFAGCANLNEVSLDSIQEIGAYSFFGTSIKATPNLENLTKIGDYAFAETDIKQLSLSDNVEIGKYAFAYCDKLESIELGNNVTIGEYAFYSPVDVSESVEESGYFKGQYYEQYDYTVVDDNSQNQQTYSYYRYKFMDNVKSSLTALVVGTGANVGAYAFAGHAKLATFSLGAGAKLGDYSFYDAIGLTQVDLSGVKAIGEYAFAASTMMDFAIVQNQLQPAYERKYVNNEVVSVGIIYTQYAPKFTEVRLDAATSSVDANGNYVYAVGQYAFANNKDLTTVVFGSKIDKVAPYTFYGCTGLSTAPSFEKVTEIGDGAFYKNTFAQIDLTNINVIGNSAFAENNELISVVFKTGVEINDSAFASCKKLATAENLSNAKRIGAFAFYGTAISELDFINVESIGDFAFGESKLQQVSFSEKLTTLGENPFYATNIATFGKWETTEFGTIEFVTTYDVSKTVKIIDDALYQSVATGLELVSYPCENTRENFTVADGTARITARAFANATLQNVVLSSQMKSIGDKAFYNCQNLAVIVFTSYEAPMLEEAYDTSYITMSNMPFTGNLAGYEGLGITPYYLWNATSSYNNYFFGANFSDYVGHIDQNMIMVRPANGKNYDTFMFSQYFTLVVEGKNALTQMTINVIAIIEALPSNITLNDEAAVIAARAAYDQIPELEQKALVTNLSKLTSAESTIKYLKMQNEDNTTSTVPPTEEEKPKLPTHAIVLIVVYSVILVAAAGVFVYFKVLKGRKNKSEKITSESEVVEEKPNSTTNLEEDKNIEE